jgi:hypothetical protein
MGNSKINQFLFFCAGINNELIVKCPRSEVIKYTSIGATVAFTTLLAVVSSYFAFNLILQDTWIKILLSFFWGAIIFNLDRFLVSSVRGKGLIQFFPRLLLAFFIALVISKPIELKLFEPEINRYLNKLTNEELESAEAVFLLRMDEVESKIQQLRVDLNNKFEQKEKYYLDYKCECDGTCGTGIRGRGTECDRKKEKYETFNNEYESLKNDTKGIIAQYEAEKKEIANEKLKKEEVVEASFTFGLLARLNALSDLPGMHSWAIMLIFMLIEAAPVFTKMMSSKGPYELLLQESEYAYKLKYLQTVQGYKQDFLKNKRIEELDEEAKLKELIKERHEKMKRDLKQKLS